MVEMNFTNHRVVNPAALAECKLGGFNEPSQGRFPVASPVEVRLSSAELSNLTSLLDDIATATEQPVPPLVRIDTIPTSNGLRVIEVNSDIPGGMSYVMRALQAYGCGDEAVRFVSAMRDVFGEAPAVLCSETWPVHRKVIAMELPYYQTAIWPGMEVRTIEENPRWCFPTGRTVFRACGRAQVEHHSPLPQAKNPWGSWTFGDKRALAYRQNPLVPHGEKRDMRCGDEVPSGLVAKSAFGLGGDEVFFPGETIHTDGSFLLQEMVQIPTAVISGTPMRYGLDVYVLSGSKGKTHFFAMSRTCRPDQKVLNISAGGGLVPGVMH